MKLLFTIDFAAPVIGLLLGSHAVMAGTPTASAPQSHPWKIEGSREGVAICSRLHEGSGLKEFKSSGLINAAPEAVYALLNDAAEYPKFMPYTAEVRILQTTDDSVTAYHRLSLPLVDDRDYILRSIHSVTQSPAGPVYHISWKPAHGIGPSPKPGIQRVTTCEGSWLLEPTADGKTKATYDVYSDTGGAIPAFLANGGSRTAIRKVFAAIRKEALNPKYAGVKS